MSGIDTYAKLVLHLDNNVTDYETTPKTVTNNNVTFSDTVKKFGTHSAYFNGSNAYLSVPDSDDWHLGYTFTIDFWVNFKVLGTTWLYRQRLSGVESVGLKYNNSTKKLEFDTYNYSSHAFTITASFNPSVDTWYHIAIVRIDNGNSASSWRIYIDGTGQTLTLAYGAWNGAYPNIEIYLVIGRNGDESSEYFNGYIDEPRVSKGIARWTANFTPPTSPYSLESRQKSRVVIIA
jgi:hypothetical protein